MKKTDIEHVIVDYLSRNFKAVSSTEESDMLTTEDFNNEFRALSIAFMSENEINEMMSEAMHYKFIGIPGTHERVWLLKRCPNDVA